MSVQLRLFDKADKEIAKLPRPVKGAIYDFQRKFRDDPTGNGLRFKHLKGESRLFSARVTDDYRAILLQVSGTEYILLAVRPRGEAYENLDRYAVDVNPVSGGIEFIDVATAAEVAAAAKALGGERVPAVPIPSASPSTEVVTPLFAAYPVERLLELGVAEPLLPLIAKITTEEELLGLTEYAPRLTTEVLLALHDGSTPEEVLEQVTAPVRAEEPVDVADYTAALSRPSTLVTTDDAVIRVALEQNFARWQVFLHPVQRKVVERHYNGPARVSGGPGTGKTIVALHRVRHLAERLSASAGKDILLTTYNKNLAADLSGRLRELAGKDIFDRVEVINIDRLASKVVAEAEPGAHRHHWMDDSQALNLWAAVLLELDESTWEPQFLHDEWSQVVLGQAITSRDDYFRARRVGRTRTLNRAQRAVIWRLVEQFTKRLADDNMWTFRQMAARAARIEQDRARRREYRYRHVVVDEAQDLSPAHWLLLRAMVEQGPNDMFLAGDTHQRIYDNYVSLGSLGINIRGRSTRLTLSYRSTHEILTVAEVLLGGANWDDLDGGTDTLDGYRSVLHGPRPVLRGYQTSADELAGIAEQVGKWLPSDGDPSIGIAVPERRQVAQVEEYLTGHGIDASAVGANGPRKPDSVHVGTLHRFKGLEYQHMLIAGVSDGAVPAPRAAQLKLTDPADYDRALKQARSLLFVAATRARDALTITWHGRPSFLLAQEADD